jgi:hypothetical protein
MSQHTIRWFVEALRDACDQALKDDMVGDQTSHIEKIEVTDPGFKPADLTDVKELEKVRPISLRVTCWGAYSPTECRRVYEDQGVIQVADMVARYLADRSIGLKDTLDDLVRPERRLHLGGYDPITGARD